MYVTHGQEAIMELLEAMTAGPREESDVTPEPGAAKSVKLRNSLFLTDFSPSSELALPYAVALAQRYRGKVYAVHVISPEMYEYLPPELVPQMRTQIQKYGQRRMEELLTHPELHQVPCEAVVLEGEIWDTLEKLVADFHIDVIIVGTRGRRGLKKTLTGAVAAEVLHRAESPVLTVGPHCGCIAPEHRAKRILYATDFSADSVRALAYAVSLAETFGATLIPTYVAPQIGADPSAQTRFEEFFEERLQELLAGQISTRSHCDYRVKFGTPADGILQAGVGDNAEVIVMGVRGAGSLVRADHHLGATADRVVSEACCPVLTVRGPG
jgi:nucleotide-binding universal stress UspA family protein